VVGQLAGGALISADIAGASWRPVFLVNVPICAAVMAVALRVLPRDRRHAAAEVDLPAVLSVALLLVVVPLTIGRSQGWPAWTWACLAAFLPAAWLFMTTQRRRAAAGGRPLLDITAISQPRSCSGCWPCSRPPLPTMRCYSPSPSSSSKAWVEAPWPPA